MHSDPGGDAAGPGEGPITPGSGAARPGAQGLEQGAVRNVAEDFKSLLDLSRRRASQAHERLRAIAAELYSVPRGLLTDAERSQLTGMIQGLVGGIVAQMRALLAERFERAGQGEALAALAEIADADLAGQLGRANFLSEPALIECAYHRMLQLQLENAARARTPVGAETGAADDVIGRLIESAPLEIAHAVTEFMVEQSKRKGPYQNPLLLPNDLPEDVARGLTWAVAACFRTALAAPFAANDPALDDAIEDAAVEAIGAGLAGASAGARAGELARRLIEARLAGPDLLVPLLRQGEAALFEAVFAALTRMGASLVRRILFEPGGESLVVCARALGLGRDQLAAILETTRGARQRPRAVDSGEVASALELFDRIDATDATRLVKRWSRDRDYLSVLRRLEGPAGNGEPKSARRP